MESEQTPTPMTPPSVHDEDEVDYLPLPRFAASDVAGVPHKHVIPLTMMRHTDRVACHFIPSTGVYAGVLCFADTIISFGPVVVPTMVMDRVVFAIEFTSYDHLDESPVCSLKLSYLGRDGKTRGFVTPPLVADGEVARIAIPSKHVRAETVLATAVQIVLMDEIPSGKSVEVPCGVEGSGKRPILVRGAWLEFPSKEPTHPRD